MKLFPSAATLTFLLTVTPRLSAQVADASSLAAAETAFAHESVARGMRTAFLDALSDEGIVFQPSPQNGIKAWRAEKESSDQLAWQPVLAVVAASGDFGYTTGPWTYKKNADDPEASAFGQFVSVWRREGGKWKLLFDLGSKNPKPVAPTPELQTVDLKSPNDSKSSATTAELFGRDREFARGSPASFTAMAAQDVRVLRAGEFPAIGKAAAEAVLQKANQPTNFTEPKGEISQAKDLGFTWGEYSDAGGGYYLHIWRCDEAGSWQLVLDLLHPR